MVMGALAAAMMARSKIMDQSSGSVRNCKKRGRMKWAIWCEAQTPEISDEESSESPRDERKWEKEIQTESERGEGQGSSQERGLMIEMNFISRKYWVCLININLN